MALSPIGAASGTNTATMPAHQSGDLLIVLAQRTVSSTAPTVVAGWTAIGTNTANTMGWRAAYKVAASSSEVVGTWTNAEQLIVLVYRGAISPYIGALAFNTGAGGGTINFSALALGAADGSRWVIGFAGARTGSSGIEAAPAGMTLRSNAVGGSNELAAFDTNGGVTSWSSVNGGDASTANWKTLVVEIIGDPPASNTTTTITTALVKATGQAAQTRTVHGATAARVNVSGVAVAVRVAFAIVIIAASILALGRAIATALRIGGGGNIVVRGRQIGDEEEQPVLRLLKRMSLSLGLHF